MSATTQKERGFFWHWQKLKKEDSTKHWLNGRAWLHHRPSGTFGVQCVIPSGSFHFSMTVGGVEDQLRLSIALWFFALYLSFEQWPWLQQWKAAADYPGRRTDFAIHHWALWWHLWTEEDAWSSETPKWRDGTFHIDDFVLGKRVHSKIEQEPTPITIPLPEGDYAASLTFCTRTWKRPRWHWPKVRHDGSIDIPSGIPIPGKGENSWDCGEDAYMSIGTSATTVEGAVQHAVASVNERRERYGGKNWLPSVETGNP